MKICFLGAGSTVFAKNVLGDCILTPSLGEFDIALHDIDAKRLEESYMLITALNKSLNGKATITKSLDRREALKDADFVINAIQVGGYKPCTVTDFKIPRKFGLKQSIGDTLGVGGIMRAMRTIPVLEEFAKDIEEVCPNAYFLNYSNPMAMLSGYMQKYTKVKVVGLCHSVQTCLSSLCKELDIMDRYEGATWEIRGINHQAWLLGAWDKDGNDLYPLIRERNANRKFHYSFKTIVDDVVKKVMYEFDFVRRDMMEKFGYYITESSEHNGEYLPYYVKNLYPGSFIKNRVLINEYPRRCRNQIRRWKRQSKRLLEGKMLEHTRSKEYGSRIIEAIFTGVPYEFNGNVLNTDGLIPNLPHEACVEVPVVADAQGFHPQMCGPLPTQCAAVNITNINPQLMAMEAIHERDLKKIKMAVALDPHTSSELSLPDIGKMCDALYKKHRKDGYLPEFKNADK